MQEQKKDQTDNSCEPLPQGTLEAPSQPLSSVMADDPLTRAALARGKSETQTAPGDTKDVVEYLWNVHGYTNAYIRFGDSKAGLVIVFDASVIAALYSADLHDLVLGVEYSQWTWANRVAAAAFTLLLAGILIAARTVCPRLWNRQNQGFVFWESILGHKNEMAFWSALLAGASQLPEHLAHHLYILAKVATHKFRWVAASMLASIFGSIAAVVALAAK